MYMSQKMECKNFPSLEHKIKSLNLCSNISSSSPEKITGNSEYCYSLLQSVAGDKEAEKRLQQERLKYVIEQLQQEREDTSFSRDCLFCRKHFTGNRTVLFDHLLEQHNFTVGAPDNIVFVNELLDHLEMLLKNLQCFYCEKVFKDWMTLKEHMRKKQHKIINPENKNYDRFYVINYLELGKTWQEIQSDNDGRYQDDDEKELMDWDEENSTYVCLFCDDKLNDFDAIFTHMKNEHNFNFRNLKQIHKLDFYKQIKLINFIRKKVYEKECIICDSKFIVQEDLIEHMTETGHITLFPDPEKWDQPIYFFPTFENDNLLCGLDCEDADCQDYLVYPEDTVLPESNVLQEYLQEEQ